MPLERDFSPSKERVAILLEQSKVVRRWQTQCQAFMEQKNKILLFGHCTCAEEMEENTFLFTGNSFSLIMLERGRGFKWLQSIFKMLI